MRTRTTRYLRGNLAQRFMPFAGARTTSRASAHAAPVLHPRATVTAYAIRARITQLDRAIIRAYFGQADAAIPRGSACHDVPLLAAPWQPLPRALECKLSALSARYKRVLAVDKVLLIDADSGRIVDAMPHVYARA